MIPILAVVGLLSFIGTFGEFIIARVVLQSEENWTLAVGLYGWVSSQLDANWGQFAAGAVIAAVPVLALFLFLQKVHRLGPYRGSGRSRPVPGLDRLGQPKVRFGWSSLSNLQLTARPVRCSGCRARPAPNGADQIPCERGAVGQASSQDGLARSQPEAIGQVRRLGP